MSDETLADSQLDTRLYDYLKYLTTLSLVAIGGVLGLLQGSVQISGRSALVAILCLGAAGVVSLMTINFTLYIEAIGKSTPKVRFVAITLQQIATALLIFGLGLFLGAFIKVLT
jgi:hypothetical protein